MNDKEAIALHRKVLKGLINCLCEDKIALTGRRTRSAVYYAMMLLKDGKLEEPYVLPRRANKS
jgi:hypothetical protein